jgi:uncharacterized protein DUF6916
MVASTLTRRAVLRAGVLGMAVAALPLRLIDAMAGTIGTNTWTYSQWSGLVGSIFRTALADGSTTQLKLIAATNLMPAGSSTTSGPQCFVLTFSGSSAALGEGIVTVSNSKVGSVQLFVVPGQSQHYDATVNRS